MDHNLYIPDRSAVADASELIDRFGVYAADEAAARARRSRGLGNFVHFCRWRQVERMIQMLSSSERTGQAIH